MKKVLAIILATMLLMSSLVMASASPENTSEEVMSPQFSNSSLRVVTQNVLTDLLADDEVNNFSLRAPRLVQVLKSYQADSIGLQECRPEWMAYLSDHLTDYAYVGVGRENGTTDASSGEACPIFYRKDKFDLLDSGTFWLSESPDIPSYGWGADYKRVCTYAVLKNKTTGEKYLHVNTHLDFSDAPQMGGMQLILDKIAELRKTYPDIPVVATADWNMSQAAKAYSLMVNDPVTDMEDALFCTPEDKIYNEGGTLCGLTGTYNYKNDSPIDHVFVSADAFDPQTYQVMHDVVDGHRVSDHYGICVELNYGAGTLVRAKGNSIPSDTAIRGTATVDGEKDTVYQSAPEIKINQTVAGSGVTDGSAYLTFDDDYLYCFVDVRDALVNDSSITSADNYEIDSVQIFYDFLNTDTSAGSGSYQFVTGESGYIFAYPQGSSKTSKNLSGNNMVACESKLTENGYTIEAQFKLSDSVKQRLKIEDRVTMGIGIQINDDENNDAKREGMIANYSPVANAYLSPSYLSELVMERGSSKPYRFAPGSANVDGVLDDSYLSAEKVSINRYMNDTVAPSEATQGYAYTIYDQNYIYSYIEVFDATPSTADVPRRSDENYGKDSVQLFYDFGSGVRGYNTIDVLGVPVQTWSDFSYKWTQTDTGYILETKTAIPDALKAKIAANRNTIIGAGFQINDDANNDAKRDQLIFSKASLQNAWLPAEDGAEFHQDYARATLVYANKITIAGAEEEMTGHYFAYGTPAAIDGTKDSAYAAAEAVQINKDPHDATVSEQATGVAYTLYDASNLYALIEVTDSTLAENPAAHTDIYGTDGVQIFLDQLDQCAYLNLNYDKTTNSWPWTMEYQMVSTTKGYNVEIRIALTDTIKTMIQSGDAVTLGFGYQINDDSNNDGSRDFYAMSKGSLDGAWNGGLKQGTSIHPDYDTALLRPAAQSHYFGLGTPDQIDGVRDAVYDSAEKLAINLDENGTNVAAASAVGVAYTLHDDEFLYSLIEVTDTTKSLTNGDGVYQTDGIQMYLDQISECSYLNLCRNGSSNLSNYAYKTGLEYKILETDVGYTVEIKTPLSESVKQQIQQGNTGITLGFGYQINDDQNNDGVRDAMIFSKPSLANAWNLGKKSGTALHPDMDTAVLKGVIAGGTVTAPKSAATGSVVTVQVVPHTGFAVNKISVNGKVLTGNTFVMPDADVNIEVSFTNLSTVPVYTITVDPAITGGTIQTSKTSAKAGEQVEVTVTPDDGMYAYSYTVNGSVTEARYFTMPDRDVTIQAVFSARPDRYAVSGSPVLDGNMDDAYTLTEAVKVNRGASNTEYTADKRAVGTVRTLYNYDEGYIYCFAEVTDLTPESENTRPVSDSYTHRIDGVDGVTFFFDFEPQNGKTWNMTEVPYIQGESGAYYCDLAAAKDNLTVEGKTMNRLTGGFDGYTAEQASFVAVKTGTGYQIELKLAMSNQLKAKKDQKDVPIGMGFIINDDKNDDGVRDSYAYSFGAMNYATSSPKYLGTMLLSDTESIPEDRLEPTTGNGDVRVVSYNVLTDLLNDDSVNCFANRAPRMTQILQKYHADSIGLQECRVEWMAYLTEHLTDYAYVGVGRENGTTNTISGEATPIFYLKDKYNLLESDTFWLSTTPDVFSYGWKAEYRRVCTFAVLQNKETEETYLHVNVHLDNSSEEARQNGIKMVLKKIDELRGKYADIPVVCTGDFNLTEESNGYDEMIHGDCAADLEDSLYCAPQNKVVNEGGTFPNFNTAYYPESSLAIDHIFLSVDTADARFYKVMHDQVDGCFVSDHYGICVEFDYSAGEIRRDDNATDSDPVKYTAGNSTVVLDGTAAKEEYSDSTKIPITIGGQNQSNISANGYFAYDKNYLYYFADVQDSTVNADGTKSNEDEYGIDSVQVFFDFLNTDTDESTSTNYAYTSQTDAAGESGYIVVYSDGRQAFRAYGAAKMSDDSLKYVVSKTASGYAVEGRIPLSDSLSAGLDSMKNSPTIGIGLQVNDDSNADGYREDFRYSAKSIESAWMSPLYCEDMILASSNPDRIAPLMGEISLDGEMDDAYQYAIPVAVDKDSKDQTVENMATGIVWTLYDENYVYGYFLVHDTTPSTALSAADRDGNYGLDSIQVFYDFGETATYSTIDAFGATVSGLNQTHVWKPVMENGVQVGYALEYRVPLSDSLKTRIKNGEKEIMIGSGYQINDDTNGVAGRERLCFSQGTIDLAWNGGNYYAKSMLVAMHSIQVDTTIAGGTVAVQAQAAFSADVNVTVKPDNGMRLVAGSLKANGVIVSGSTFTMPNENVLLTAEFEKIPDYTITTDSLPEGITIIPSKTVGLEGEKITLDIQLAEGKYLSSIRYNGMILPDNADWFIMPAESVVITAKVTDRPSYQAYKGTAQLDGVMDDAYQSAQTIKVAYGSTGKEYNASNRAVGTVRTIYDNGFLYCFAEIVDSTVNADTVRPQTDAYTQRLDGIDGIHFYFDFLNSDRPGIGDSQYGYVDGESGAYYCDLTATDDKTSDGEVFNRYFGGFSNGGSYVAVKTETGYCVEMKIALSDSLKTRLSTNEKNIAIGMGCILNDDQNNDGIRDSYAFSDQNMYYAPNSPKYLGTMILAENTTPGGSSSSQPEGTSSSTPSQGSSESSVSAGSNQSGSTVSGSTPATGNASNQMLWLAIILIVAAISAAGIVLFNQQKANKEFK